ncbi:hypothetical protein [uncultured Gammaproteobacteria bacterium]|jgi:hypothetical protein|nr:hypothetical protein [uncultured Gammaproteobacteria bacterium]CAC9958312.1 hypothetical protein [uncultured Gammaproteobacteria bacterium]CAC9966132.1 hypothetical protein [uncultured Gammaproteobacteria bacterium]
MSTKSTDWMKRCGEKSVLLLEGKSDCNIVKKFCEDNKINTQFGFCNCENDNQVLSKLNALLQGSNQPEIIGIAIMHTYFAWQDSPSDPLHSAINKIALDNNKKIAKTFKA